MSTILNSSRREFLKDGTIAGGCLILGFRIPPGREASAANAAVSSPAPALANAIYAATGTRIRELPMPPAMVKGVRE